MLIAHIGAVFYPDQVILAMIGRLCFPIFAFLIAVGYNYTKNINKYITRLLIFAAISQIPFYLFSGKIYRLNTIFTLVLGVILIVIYKRFSLRISIPIIIIASIISELAVVDYGFYGILMILFFNVFDKSKLELITAQFLNYLLFFIIYAFAFSDSTTTLYIQGISLLSIPIIFMFNNKKGPSSKYFFYIFYPVHLIILILIKMNLTYPQIPMPV